MAFSSLKIASIVLFLAILVVWVIAINFKSEHSWAMNPWLPTTVGALLGSIWLDSSDRY